MDGFGERRHGDGWSKRERETKLTEGEDFRGEATSNKEKPKEEKE